MPYSLKKNCVIRSDTGATVKCHPSRTRARRHLAALMANVPEAKALADADTGKPTGGRKPMTRAEAARHASLVRWKKESPYAANVMERLAQIRAKRLAKGRGKGKTKGGKGKAAKPKAPPKEQQAAQNRAAALDKLSSKPNAAAMGALDSLRKGEAVDPDMAESLAGETGLVQKHSDGSYSLSSAGRAFLSALDKGDAAAAHDVLSGAGDKLAKQDEQKQRKADREKARVERATAREKRKKAKGGGKKKPPAEDKEQPDDKAAAQAQREKERQEDRAARLADRAQRNKERAEDRAQRAKERTVREKERLADRAQRQKERAEDRAERAKDRAERRKRQADKDKKLPRGDTRQTVKAIDTMDELTPILSDMQATVGELTEVAEDALAAVKAGARNNRADMATINQGYELSMQLCDLFESLGADTGEGDEEEEEDDTDMESMKAIAADPIAYAQHECADIAGACGALTNLAYLAASEAAERDEDTPANLAKLRQSMTLLLDFIGAEIGEIKATGINQAAIDLLRSWKNDGDEEEQRATWAALVAADPDTFKAITRRDDVSPVDKERAVSEYGDVSFADEKNKKYPIDTEEHIRAAWNYASKPDNAAKYDPNEIAAIKKKIVTAWKKVIDKAGPPSAADATKKSTDLSSLKGIEFVGVDGEEIAVLPGYSVKAIEGNEGWTQGYLIRFGGSGDLTQWRDVFTKDQTDYGHAKSSDVWVHHRMLPGVGKRRLTNPAELSFDDEGIFIKHLLNMRDPYERQLYTLVEQGKLGWSSGVPSHLSERKALGDGRHQIVCWPLGCDSSYTPCPAGGFSVDAKAVKSLFDEAGLDLLAAIYDEPEMKALDERARALALDLDLLELELAMEA